MMVRVARGGISRDFKPVLNHRFPREFMMIHSAGFPLQTEVMSPPG